MEDQLDIILQSLTRIEDRIRKIENHCKENESNFVREVGANVLGDYIYSVFDKAWIRKNN